MLISDYFSECHILLYVYGEFTQEVYCVYISLRKQYSHALTSK